MAFVWITPCGQFGGMAIHVNSLFYMEKQGGISFAVSVLTFRVPE